MNHREIEGTIKKTKSQEWYIALAVEKEDNPFISNNRDKVGMDLGINKYAVLSDGSIVQNKHISKADRTKLKRLQRIISRRKKGSHKRRKAVLNYARKYEHTARIREDWLHKLSYNLVNSYSFIAYEELKVANMMKNHHLARSIGEESWGNFINYLQYKAESAGCVVVGVNPKDTSKTCSECGNIQDMLLFERTFHCQKCGMSKDRDLNASINILKRATSGQGGSHASGDIVSPSAMKADFVERGTIRVA